MNERSVAQEEAARRNESGLAEVGDGVVYRVANSCLEVIEIHRRRGKLWREVDRGEVDDLS